MPGLSQVRSCSAYSTEPPGVTEQVPHIREFGRRRCDGRNPGTPEPRNPGTPETPEAEKECTSIQVEVSELRLILEGIDLKSVRRRKRYVHRPRT